MAVKRKKKRKKKTAVTPRNPFWRLRRIFGEKRAKSPKAYDRGETKKAEREAAGDGD